MPLATTLRDATRRDRRAPRPADAACSASRTTGRSWATAANTINTLRLWKAATPDVFNFGEFSGGDFFGAVSDRVLAESRHPGAVPGRLHAPRPVAAVPPGVLPRPLLAGRHHHPLPQTGQRLGGAAGQGRDPAERHPPGDGRPGTDANPARRGETRLGRRRGI